MVINTSRDVRYLLSSKTSSIERDVKDIRLATSSIYRVMYKIDTHASYGFTYYYVVFQYCERVSFQSHYYNETVLSMLS